MALIEAGSEPSMLLESHLFYLPATLTERWNTKDYDIGPSQATFDDANDIVFTIAPCQSELVSLADIRFTCDLYITKADGVNKPTADDLMAPINNILHSLFQSVSVSLNGRQITDPSNMYHMRAYLESLLGYSKDAQRSQLFNSGFALDSSLNLTSISAVKGKDGSNIRFLTSEGAQTLRDLMVAYQPLQLSGKLHCDLFQQDRPLIPGVEVVIKLVRNRTALCFIAESDALLPKVAVRNPRIHVRKYEPSPDFLTAMTKQLLITPVKYHIERVVMRQHTLTAGQQQATWSNIVIGQQPKVMYLVFVPSSAFAGVHDKTPFNFQHFDISYVSAEIDGQLYPTRGYELNFSNGGSLAGYDGLLDCLERLHEPGGSLPFNRIDYNKGGFTIFGFDFTRGHTGRGALSLMRQGNLNVSMKFRKELPEGVMCVAMLVFDNVIEINNNRQVLFDFAP